MRNVAHNPTQPTGLHQIVCESMINGKVMLKSMIGPDDTGQRVHAEVRE